MCKLIPRLTKNVEQLNTFDTIRKVFSFIELNRSYQIVALALGHKETSN